MADNRLSLRDRELFLAQPHIAALSVSAGPDRGPLMIPGTDELLQEISERYLPPEKVPAYMEFARVDFGEQVAIYLRPRRWLSADLGPG